MSRTAALIPALFTMLFMSTPGLAQDATDGEIVFKKCSACHQVGADAKNRVGPVLQDVIGRTAGTHEGFKYSADMVAAGEKGLVWTEELVAGFIANPSEFLRTYLEGDKAKSKMSFKLKNEQKRLDVAAYLASVSGPETAPETGPETAPVPEAKAPPVETRSVKEVIADQVFSDDFLADPNTIAAGKVLWDGQCTLCHGAKAYPGKAPKLKPARYKPTFIFKRAYKGFKGMPAWREIFTIDELRSIVAYIKSPGFSP